MYHQQEDPLSSIVDNSTVMGAGGQGSSFPRRATLMRSSVANSFYEAGLQGNAVVMSPPGSRGGVGNSNVAMHHIITVNAR